MRSFFLFSSVGTVGFLVDAGILFVLIPYLGPYVGRLFSFLAAVLVTWLLNRYFTFNSRNHRMTELKRYLTSQSFGAGLNYIVYAVAIFSFEWMARFPLAALALGSIAGLAVNFFLAKKYVFKVIVNDDCELPLPKGRSFQLQRGNARHNAESKVPSTGSTGYSLRQAELSAREKSYTDAKAKSRASLHPPPEGRGFTDKMDKMTSRVARKIWQGYSMPVALLLAVIIGGVISLLLGQDTNWDIKNYHIHNAWALLNHRMGVDIFTAGIQTYFNPLLDVPYYLVAIEWFPDNPRLVAFLMGLPAGILLFFVWLCASEVIRAFKIDKFPAYLMTIIVVLIGMTGAATLPQWGATFNEIQVAALVVAGLYAILVKIDIDTPNLKWFVVAGVCLGVAGGLKLTAAIYAPGAFLAIAIVSRNLKLGALRALWFSVAWWSGFLLFYGWWGYRLYKLTGSPMFPMFNAVFNSPLIGAGSGMDDRFKPTGFAETLFYPFHWLSANSMVVIEPAFADPRFALAYLALLTIGLAYIYYLGVKGLNLMDAFSGEFVPRQASALLIWLVVSFVLWQFMFSILRYAVPIEVFTGLVVLIGFLVIARMSAAQNHSLLIISMLSAMAWVCATYTQYPEWGRVGYGKQMIEVADVALPDNSLVVFSGPPVAYLAPFLSKSSTGATFIGIVDELRNQRDYPLWTKVVERISTHSGAIYMVERPEQRHMRSILPEFGLLIKQASCREYQSSIDQPFTVCELQKT